MASHAPDFGRASALPLSALLASIPSYPRPVLERLVARLIDHLDEQDGDQDLEPDDPGEDDTEDCGGDEGEPDYRKRRRWRRNESGPGCIISDADYGSEEAGEPEPWSDAHDHPAELFIGKR